MLIVPFLTSPLKWWYLMLWYFVLLQLPPLPSWDLLKLVGIIYCVHCSIPSVFFHSLSPKTSGGKEAPSDSSLLSVNLLFFMLRVFHLPPHSLFKHILIWPLHGLMMVHGVQIIRFLVGCSLHVSPCLCFVNVKHGCTSYWSLLVLFIFFLIKCCTSLVHHFLHLPLVLLQNMYRFGLLVHYWWLYRILTWDMCHVHWFMHISYYHLQFWWCEFKDVDYFCSSSLFIQ